jgi:threonyl-tRNA synthetase
MTDKIFESNKTVWQALFKRVFELILKVYFNFSFKIYHFSLILRDTK